MTYTYAELQVSEATWNEIAQKLRAAGYDHAFDNGTIDMHGIGLTKQPRIMLLRLVGTDANDRVNHAADVVYELALTHMIAGLKTANRLRAEAGMPALSVDEVRDILTLMA